MKHLLITGGTGFLGGHLCRHLVSLDYHLHVLVRPSSDKSELKKLAKSIRFFEEHEITTFLEESSIKLDGIIHTATDYGRHGDKELVFNVNHRLPKTLLELAIAKKIPSFINIDSFSSLIEDYPYLPHYHASKRAFLKDAKQRIQTNYEGSFSTLRLHHLYGTEDDDRKFIPFIIRSLIAKEEEIDLTAGIQKRDFVFVSDVVDAIEKVLTIRPSGEQEFEVGTGQCHSIREFVVSAKKLAENKNTQLNFGALETRANELMEAVADNAKLIDLGWKPKFPLEKGIKETIKYYRDKMS